MALWNNDLLVFRRLFKIKSYFLSTFHGLFEYSFAQDNIYGMWHLETYGFFCCLSGSGATKVASDVDETLPLENPGEAIQAAKAAADSLEVPDTQPRPDLDDIFSDAMPNETWLPKDEPDVGKESKAWFDPKTKIYQSGTRCITYPLLCRLWLKKIPRFVPHWHWL